jgi:hypothetical protein
MGQYTNKGLYNKYKKNNKEREALDFYSTPTSEVTNIMLEAGIIVEDKTILEPCVGGGHMLEGILAYNRIIEQTPRKIIATDVKDRGYTKENIEISYGEDYDFLSDDYPIDKADLIIMNPPYSTIEPFVIRALEIAPEVLMLGRTQFLESESRYENIFKNNPPNKVFQYVDRIQCYKNGDTSISGSSAQAYAWFYWNRNQTYGGTYLNWLRRSDKQ